MKTYSGNILQLEPNQIYVFTSNTEGKHTKGSALLACKYFGAIYGVSWGIQGQSYGICIYDSKEKACFTIEHITNQISGLYMYAAVNTDKEFVISCTIATNFYGYTTREVARMFAIAGPIPENIIFNDEFAKLIDTSLWASKDLPKEGNWQNNIGSID